MILSHSKKFVVFQAWKTASSTLYLRLAKFNQSPYSRFYYFNPYLKRIVHQHITVADFKALPECLPGYKRAAFVRNPYDRVYSGFIQIQRDLKEQPSLPYPEPWIKEHVLKQLAANEEKLKQANYDFNQWVGLLDEADIYQIGGNSSLPLYPSHYWTHDGEQVFADFIGKVEQFEADFAKMLEWLDIKADYTLENDNVTTFEDQQADPLTGYKYINKMTKNSIDRINTLFAADFQLFGYAAVNTAQL